MANSFKIAQATLNAADTDVIALRGVASTTLVKGVYFIHEDHNTIVMLSLEKSGGTKTPIRDVAHTAGDMTQLLPDTMALESGDILYVQSDHISSTDVGYVVVNYVEDTQSVSGQSIGVLTDVDLTGLTDGDALVYDSNSGNFEPGTAGGGNVDSVNGATGVVVLSIDNIDDVDTTGVQPNDVLIWNGSDWVDSNRLTELYSLLKQGTSKILTAEPTNADTTEGFVQLEATAAKLKVNKTGVEISETSPGDINLNVATDSSGTTEFTAVHIDGQTAANEARVIVKQGALLAIEGSSNSQATIRSTNSGSVLLNVPASSGTLALTSDITAAPVDSVNGATGTVVLDTDDVSEGSNLYYTEARVSANSDVAANTAKVGITTQQATDITTNNAKNTYPSADATKLAGIAAGAEVNAVDSVNTQTGAVVLDADDISDAATTNKFTTAADISKLSGIAAGAEVNVQSDWNATSGDALILNKPTIPSDTNLGNTNLTANADRTYSVDGNVLTFDTASGDFIVKNGVTNTYVEASGQDLILQGLTYPASDGTNGQVLTTNGLGSLSFTTVSGGGGGGTPLASADQTLTADRLIDTNGYNLEIELDATGTADTFTIHDGTHDLFEVNTNTSGTLFSVNDVSGLPTFQSNDDGSAVMPKVLTAAPTGTATEGTMQLAIVSGTSYLYVYINGAWRKTTLA